MTEQDVDVRCPCCGGSVEHYQDQDGAADYLCCHCAWSEHIPSGSDIAAALTLQLKSQPGKSPATQTQLPPDEKVGLKLLQEQAAILRKVVEGTPLTDDERSSLEGLWELVHRMLDRTEDEGSRSSIGLLTQ